MKKFASLLILLTGLLLSAHAQTSCNASLTWSQTPNTYSVNFTNTSTVSPAMPPSAFATTAHYVVINGLYHNSNPTYTHTFPGPGSYYVIAYVSYIDSIGPVGISCQDTTWYNVVVAQQPCGVNITSMTGTGLTRSFIANGGSGVSGTVYSWNFGDGSSAATGITASHTYTAAGTYTVTVTATGGGCTNTATITVMAAPVLNCANVNSSFTSSNTGSTYTFNPTSTPAATVNIPHAYYWYFGDGTSGYGNGAISHTYAFNGTYLVKLLTVWQDSINSTGCSDTGYATSTVTNAGSFTCANASSTFSSSGGQGTYKLFTPIINPSSTPGVTVSNFWNYGDGSMGTTTGMTMVGHGYQSAGTYNVCLITSWLQNGTTNVLCADTSCQSVTVTIPNIIYGYVSVDSFPMQPVDTFRVWLISYNASTSMLTAADSVTVFGVGGAGFQFSNAPAGIYRTKAHKLNQANLAFGYVPTYRDSSLTWSGAQTFTHNNGTTYSGTIVMRQGLVTSGPGFVSGNVLMGANKGTADGDPVVNQLVFLRNAATGALVQSAYTNAAGQYSFSNIPLGSYIVYPEAMNYATTPSSIITLSATSASVSNIFFKKDDVDMDIKPVSATGIGVAAASTYDFIMVPNPTSGKVSLTFPGDATREADVRVTSMTGQVVYTGKLQGSSLDLAHLQSGIYFITVATQKGTGTEKLVITR